jgi:gamma-glutamyltranspeptidase/glutathione hydrolase
MVLETLNLLKRLDLKAMGHNSAEYLHAVVEALKLAAADRERYFGDPDFIDVPLDRLLSED